MIIKKTLLFAALFIFSMSFCFAGIRDSEDDVFMEKEVIKEKDCSKQLADAKKYYFEGDFSKAEKYIDEALLISSDDIKANELKNKILLLKEKESFYKRTLVNDYLIELRRTIKDGNYYEGFLFIKKINNLSPEEDVNFAYMRLSSEKELVLSAIESSIDKKNFIDSIDYFTNEQFFKSSKLIYKLYNKYPKFADFVGMSRYYIIKETNNSRVKKLYKEAIKNLKSRRYGKARNYAELAYSLQPENIKLRILLEQINMEII